jgi:hypothetical protein
MCGMEGYIAYEWVSYVNVLSEDPPAGPSGNFPSHLGTSAAATFITRGTVTREGFPIFPITFRSKQSQLALPQTACHYCQSTQLES